MQMTSRRSFLFSTSLSPLVLSLALVPAAACSHAAPRESSPLPGTSVTSSAVTSASASAPGSPSSSSSSVLPTEEASLIGAWKGSYHAKVATVQVPKDAHVNTWSKDPGSTNVGEGTLSLTLSADATGKYLDISGTGQGALGDFTLSGVLDKDGPTARIQAKDPKDPAGMYGVLHGKLESGKLVVSLQVANHDASLVRSATATLSR